MEIQISQKFCILTPLSPIINERETLRLKEEINKYSDLAVGLDLSFVQDCTIEFFEAIKKLNAACFNIHSDIFSLFSLMNLDKSISLYVTEEDFKNDTHRLLNRHFQIV